MPIEDYSVNSHPRKPFIKSLELSLIFNRPTVVPALKVFFLTKRQNAEHETLAPGMKITTIFCKQKNIQNGTTRVLFLIKVVSQLGILVPSQKCVIDPEHRTYVSFHVVHPVVNSTLS